MSSHIKQVLYASYYPSSFSPPYLSFDILWHLFFFYNYTKTNNPQHQPPFYKTAIGNNILYKFQTITLEFCFLLPRIDLCQVRSLLVSNCFLFQLLEMFAFVLRWMSSSQNPMAVQRAHGKGQWFAFFPQSSERQERLVQYVTMFCAERMHTRNVCTHTWD